MTHVFYLDFYPDAHLVTAANPQAMLWNGWEVPNPTPRELIRYLDELRPHMGDDEWWDTLSAFMSAYGNDRHDDLPDCGLDDTTGFHMGFTWQARQMFDPNMSPMNKAEAAGHRMRMGHDLVAYLMPTDNDILEHVVMKRVLLCCPQSRWLSPSVLSVPAAQFDAMMGDDPPEQRAPLPTGDEILADYLKSKGLRDG